MVDDGAGGVLGGEVVISGENVVSVKLEAIAAAAAAAATAMVAMVATATALAASTIRFADAVAL
jgi:hypothetical protein